jgi:hypothetical protein
VEKLPDAEQKVFAARAGSGTTTATTTMIP